MTVDFKFGSDWSGPGRSVDCVAILNSFHFNGNKNVFRLRKLSGMNVCTLFGDDDAVLARRNSYRSDLSNYYSWID